jgi:polyisoprenoid-binding protein YceI
MMKQKKIPGIRVLALAVLSLMLSAVGANTAGAAEYAIDTSHSSVNFQIKHLAISKVNGSFNDFKGSFTFDPANPGAMRASAVIQAASVDTGNEKRDDHLRNPDFFDVTKFPTLEFETTGVKMSSADEGQVTGNLTIMGQARPVTLDLEIHGIAQDPWGNERAAATLSGKINRKDWGLTYNSALETGGLLIGEEVKITLEIQGIRQ